jgi:hypothetical protein
MSVLQGWTTVDTTLIHRHDPWSLHLPSLEDVWERQLGSTVSFPTVVAFWNPGIICVAGSDLGEFHLVQFQNHLGKRPCWCLTIPSQWLAFLRHSFSTMTRNIWPSTTYAIVPQFPTLPHPTPYPSGLRLANCHVAILLCPERYLLFSEISQHFGTFMGEDAGSTLQKVSVVR